MKKEIEAMLKDGVVKPSMSDWASPTVLIEKKDGGIRFCMDYRKLNAVTQGDAYLCLELMNFWSNWVIAST